MVSPHSCGVILPLPSSGCNSSKSFELMTSSDGCSQVVSFVSMFSKYACPVFSSQCLIHFGNKSAVEFLDSFAAPRRAKRSFRLRFSFSTSIFNESKFLCTGLAEEVLCSGLAIESNLTGLSLLPLPSCCAIARFEVFLTFGISSCSATVSFNAESFRSSSSKSLILAFLAIISALSSPTVPSCFSSSKYFFLSFAYLSLSLAWSMTGKFNAWSSSKSLCEFPISLVSSGPVSRTSTPDKTSKICSSVTPDLGRSHSSSLRMLICLLASSFLLPLNIFRNRIFD
mmetsp:Transcript_29735/g.72430  ORF Transcript_29735/g.72430 Transcript_29735/m.72430 type:complete len:284 (+) Transcript_29735:351-1202(+)